MNIKKLNNSGQALAWAMMMILVFLLLGVSALSMSSAMFSRSIHNNDEKQAYLTAKSAVDTVSSLFKTDKEFLDEMENLISPIMISNVNLGENMGTCSVTISKEVDSFKVTANSAVNNATKKLSAILYNSETIGGEFPKEPNNGGIVDDKEWMILDPIGTNENTAIYSVDRTNKYAGKGAGKADLTVTGVSDIFIYVKSGVTLTINKIIHSSPGNIFFILEDDSTLYLNRFDEDLTFNIYVYGQNATLESGEGTIINGDVLVKNDFTSNIQLNKKNPIHPDYSFDKIGNGVAVKLYDISKYVDEH